jgi:hypothetical protein
MYKEIKKCRICNNANIIEVLSLGNQYLTGVFPKNKIEKITRGPLELVLCSECSLLQLKHSFPLEEMYGDNYGYRSSLNQSMVKHLESKVSYLENLCNLSSGDIVVDIGSNDATTLKSYNNKSIRRIGIDPVGSKFKNFYTEGIELITDYFPSDIFNKKYPNKKAKIITSIAMFYDLESPGNFVKEIASNLSIDGIWHFEQSYMPLMLRMNAYDTICHEHLEFYSLTVIEQLLKKYDLSLIDVQINDINGGSFAVTACHKDSTKYKRNETVINWLLAQENEMALSTIDTFKSFRNRINAHKNNLLDLLQGLKQDGKTIIGYGASTKGNVLLQYCGITENEIPFIAEVNEEKFGSYTPGTNIPIISEKDASNLKPDYYFVLPWHFKHNILNREMKFISKGGKFIFPLPYLEII